MKSTIRFKFTAVFAITIAIVLLLIWGLNTFGLQNFYVNEKIKIIDAAYEEIDPIIVEMDDHATSENVDKVYSIIKEYSEGHNITISVINILNNSIISSEKNTDALIQRLRNNVFGNNTAKDYKVIKEGSDYKVAIDSTDASGASYIECYRYCSNDISLILMSTPVESVVESVKLSNRFVIYAGITALILGILVASLLTRAVTLPILRLTNLSQKMSHFEFDERYSGKQKDEIGILGQNINFMADTLEDKINELKETNSKLQEQLNEKIRQEKINRDFIANISHELKTPIALIQGYAEGLSEGLAEDEESRKYYADVIADESEKMSSLVRQLLTLNQIESGLDALELSDFNISELIKAIIESEKILLEDKRVDIQMNIDENIIVRADEFKIESVVSNYVSNAFRHVNDDGKVLVSLKDSQTEGNIECSIFNTGSNIPEEDIPHIWEKFYKVDKAHSRSYGGTGIGLSIVKAVLDAHKMPYGVANKEGGVEFWFELRKL